MKTFKEIQTVADIVTWPPNVSKTNEVKNYDLFCAKTCESNENSLI